MTVQVEGMCLVHTHLALTWCDQGVGTAWFVIIGMSQLPELFSSFLGFPICLAALFPSV